MTSLDTSTLDNLFQDDWENLYKPLQIVDTNLVNQCNCNCTGVNNLNIEAKLDELLDRQDILEEKISQGGSSSDSSIDENKLKALENKINDVSVYIQNVELKIDDVSVRLEEQGNTLISKINDISIFVQTQIENVVSKIDDVSTSIHTQIENVIDKIDDVSLNLQTIKNNQDEINEFLETFNKWENQSGEVL